MQTTSDPHNGKVRVAQGALGFTKQAACEYVASPAVTSTSGMGGHRSVHTERRLLTARFALLAASLLLAVVALLVAAPTEAFAKSYDMTKVDIAAQANTDGSLTVVEQRTFDFDGKFTAVWWTFEGLPSNAKLIVNSMRMANVDGDGNVAGEWEALPSVPFVFDWRHEGGPGIDAYSVDTPMNTVYAFFNIKDAKAIIELDYTVVNGVQAYKDVGEVYWKYVGDQWEEPSSDVNMTLTLPVPQDVAVEAGQNVRAWGHGPLDGSLTINADGSVSYTVPKVHDGQYAEARVVFPVEWLTHLSYQDASLHGDETHLDQVLTEEKGWADQANRSRLQALGFIVALGVLCVLLIVWALWAYFRFGKEYAPSFTDEYWRDVPDPRAHPAVIARLWRWDHESQDDFTATLMHLSHIGAIRIDRGTYEKQQPSGHTETVEDYYITLVPAVADAIENPIDWKALDLLFDGIAGGADSLWFGSIEAYGEKDPEQFLELMEDWQGVVSAETNRWDFFEAKGNVYHFRFSMIAILLALASFAALIVFETFIPVIFMVPTALVLAVIGNYMPRRSGEGNNLVAKCKALRNWLRDFSSLDERPPTDVRVWGEFMVYAYIFGIAKKVMEELATSVPELFEPEAGVAYTSGYVPWWFWYAPMQHSNGSVTPAAGDILHTSVSNTIEAAEAATSAASGNFSGGGGGGGGFSGGGGGGFGGGGGAR